METTEQAAWDQRYSGPDLVWGAGPNRGHGGPQGPDRLYTPALVTAELGGLGIRRAEQVLRAVQAPGGKWTAIDTLVRAERPA